MFIGQRNLHKKNLNLLDWFLEGGIFWIQSQGRRGVADLILQLSHVLTCLRRAIFSFFISFTIYNTIEKFDYLLSYCTSVQLSNYSFFKTYIEAPLTFCLDPLYIIFKHYPYQNTLLYQTFSIITSCNCFKKTIL